MVKSIAFVAVVVFFCTNCAKRDRMPETAYDPELLEMARQIKEQQELERQAYEQAHILEQRKAQTECSHETGGCKKGQVCWDSWYCKRGFTDQCSSSGDKKCHKKCADRRDCPNEMPICREVPIFNGSDQGVLEKICVGSQE